MPDETSQLAYSTSTAEALARDTRIRDGIVVTCSQCGDSIRLYCEVAPTVGVVCGTCEDWG